MWCRERLPMGSSTTQSVPSKTVHTICKKKNGITRQSGITPGKSDISKLRSNNNKKKSKKSNEPKNILFGKWKTCVNLCYFGINTKPMQFLFLLFFKILLNYSQPTLIHSAGRTELSIAISYHDWLDHLLSPSTMCRAIFFFCLRSHRTARKNVRGRELNLQQKNEQTDR